jgi:hypothetical protein
MFTYRSGIGDARCIVLPSKLRETDRVRGGQIEAARQERREKEDAMKKQIAVVAMLVAAIAAGQCYAQHLSLKADIPFAFQVGNRTMPAGEYGIQRALAENPSLQRIRRTDSGANAVAQTVLMYAKDGKSEPALVFHKYGNSYFLSEIWTGEAQGRKLYQSDREKELAREATGTDVTVLLQAQPERGL